MNSCRPVLLLLALVACSDDTEGGITTPDAPPAVIVDAPPGCDPATVLPSNYRPIAMTSTGVVDVTSASGTYSGSIDATAGGLAAAADNPYIYIDLKTGTKAAVSDLDARTSMTWDLALKRSSLRINGGDSGPGGRTLAVVPGTSLAIAAPSTGYTSDDFTTDDCMLTTIPGGEPSSAFGEWYDYDVGTHAVTPRAEVYVLERSDGSRTAFRIVTYYGDTASPMRGAFYRVEWKQL